MNFLLAGVSIAAPYRPAEITPSASSPLRLRMPSSTVVIAPRTGLVKDNVQLAALSDPTRRRIFELVGARPRTVAEITRELTVSQSAVFQHLKVAHLSAA
jgi:hypothetical protein